MIYCLKTVRQTDIRIRGFVVFFIPYLLWGALEVSFSVKDLGLYDGYHNPVIEN